MKPRCGHSDARLDGLVAVNARRLAAERPAARAAAGERRDESKAYIGGFSVVDVPSREEALDWAGRIAVACRCAQEVREFVPGSTP